MLKLSVGREFSECLFEVVNTETGYTFKGDLFAYTQFQADYGMHSWLMDFMFFDYLQSDYIAASLLLWHNFCKESNGN